MVFADDAAKIQRIYDNLGLDYVKAEAGEASCGEDGGTGEASSCPLPNPAKRKLSKPSRALSEFEVGGFEV